ncbi:hypothetical protein MICH65_0814 [Candidatus Chazhemtobacterium aquaticus]|uniref:Uncharacterized protein n=1 Tax=Candidatus Chazhemtobacterium aquaticus TaxID=2715735 RepID=A0A857N697_9BACT|nr:hypothetical protein MICH65_0814 [Candidatus Chazhemtobacterium aquaticus]
MHKYNYKYSPLTKTNTQETDQTFIIDKTSNISNFAQKLSLNFPISLKSSNINTKQPQLKPKQSPSQSMIPTIYSFASLRIKQCNNNSQLHQHQRTNSSTAFK